MSERISLTTTTSPMATLVSELRFDFERGLIEFSDKRVALVHLSLYGKLITSLTKNAGYEMAGKILEDIGKEEGSKYEGNFPGITKGRSFGLRNILYLHAMSGLSSPEIVSFSSKPGRKFYCELILNNSFEAEAYKAYSGTSDHPVCWVQVGHLTELVSRVFGRQIVFTETDCQAMGSDSCRVVGREESAETPRRSTASSALRSNLPAQPQEPHIIGSSSHLSLLVDNAKKVAVTNAAVLISGETGVGKEQMARAIHFHSRRNSEPFIAVNCGALPNELIEAEMFGIAKGAYTGAVAARAGRFERAHGGTLFLDEVGTLPLEAQVKLLRVLEDGIIERLGETHSRHVDVRLIAATNLDLHEEMRSGRFRSDLYHRLAVFPIHIPPLRDRSDDIPALIGYLLPRAQKKLGKKIAGLGEGAVDYLMNMPWEGNVRELQHRLERAIILTEEKQFIEVSHLCSDRDRTGYAQTDATATKSITHRRPATNSGLKPDLLVQSLLRLGSIKDIERAAICAALSETRGNRGQAARMLGFTRSQMAYRMRQMGIGQAHETANSSSILAEL